MSTGASYGYSQPSYGMGGMGGYGGMSGYGGMGGMYGSYNPYQMGGMGGYGNQYNPFGMSNYGMSNPYAQMGFGGNYNTGYTDPFASSFSNPFSGGYGTTFGGYGGGMGGYSPFGGYNPFGGYGQVGLGYLPPQQQTINDTVANQFMQQYYGGAFGLGAQPQPQPRRRRPRNPFRNRLEAQPFAMPSQEVTPNYPVGATPPSNILQSAAMPDYRTGPEAPVDVSGMSFANSQPSVVNPLPSSFSIDPSLLAELSYLRF